MRYRETGQVHLDFHRTLNGTVAYLRRKHGVRFLDQILRRTAHAVYRAIRRDLRRGDPEQLVEHWAYFFGREGGAFRIDREDGEIRLTVRRCPAIAYLRKRGIAVDPAFCRQTVVVNAALAEGTPFEITTDVRGGGRCVQTIRRRRP